MKFEQITVDPNVCMGIPCIRGLRFPVSRLLGLLASGETVETILKAYPYLEAEDINEAMRYAAFLAERETLELASSFPYELYPRKVRLALEDAAKLRADY